MSWWCGGVQCAHCARKFTLDDIHHWLLCATPVHRLTQTVSEPLMLIDSLSQFHAKKPFKLHYSVYDTIKTMCVCKNLNVKI